MKYSYSKVEELCSQMESINIDMKKRLEAIESAISTVGSNWTGEAANFYLKNSKKLTSNFEEFFTELKACVLYMQKCSDNYEKLEKDIQNQITEALQTSKIFN